MSEINRGNEKEEVNNKLRTIIEKNNSEKVLFKKYFFASLLCNICSQFIIDFLPLIFSISFTHLLLRYLEVLLYSCISFYHIIFTYLILLYSIEFYSISPISLTTLYPSISFCILYFSHSPILVVDCR